MRPDLRNRGRFRLVCTLPPESACHSFNPATISPDVAITLSMIVEMTSLIPRVTLSTPATPA